MTFLRKIVICSFVVLIMISVVSSDGFAEQKLSQECLKAIEEVKEQSQLPVKEMTESLKKDLGEFTDFNTKRNYKTTRRLSSYLLSWVTANITSSLSFASNDIERRQNEVKTAYTEKGWNEFQSYLKENGIVDYIKNGQFTTKNGGTHVAVIKTVVMDVPDIYGIKFGPKWEIWMNLISTYSTENSKKSHQYKAIVYVSWIVDENGDGAFKISGFKVKEKKRKRK